MTQRGQRRTLGNALIGIAVVLLLGIGGAWGWEQWQGQLLQDRLRTEPATSSAVSTSSTTPTFEPAATTRPAETPEATATPAASPAPTLALAATATQTPASLPATKPVRLEISDLKIDVPVSDMTWHVANTPDGPITEWQVPENAAGHSLGSALLGEPGNLVISGHNNIYGRVFMSISQAWPEENLQKLDAFTDRSDILNGRRISLTGEDGRRFDYVVTAFYRVKDSGVPLEQRHANAKYMDPTAEPQLTLITCWPPWTNTHRLILIAQPARQ